MGAHERHGDLRGVAAGDPRPPEYIAWKNMRRRCAPTYRRAQHYADRGIIVCARWRRSYATFLADVGRRPLGPTRFTLERVDNDRGYEPSNVVWATYHEQLLNRRPPLVTRAISPYWMKDTWGRDSYICVFPKLLPPDWRV